MINNTENLDINTYYSKEDEGYITDCKEYMNVVGCGDTKEESLSDFNIHLKAFLSAKSVNKAIVIANKGGRPRKNNTRLNCNISKCAKSFIDEYCSVNNLKTGQFIEKLVDFYQKQN